MRKMVPQRGQEGREREESKSRVQRNHVITRRGVTDDHARKCVVSYGTKSASLGRQPDPPLDPIPGKVIDRKSLGRHNQKTCSAASFVFATIRSAPSIPTRNLRVDRAIACFVGRRSDERLCISHGLSSRSRLAGSQRVIVARRSLAASDPVRLRRQIRSPKT